MSGVYLATWYSTLSLGEMHQQVSAGPYGLFLACEAMRRMRGMVVDLDDARMLLDYTRGEVWDIGPRCQRDECSQLCQDPGEHADQAVAAWQSTQEREQ